MLSKNLRDLITTYQNKVNADNITLDEIVSNCRNYLFNKTKNENKDFTNNQMETLINNYIIDNLHKWSIKQFTDRNGQIKKSELIKAVSDNILRFGIIQDVLNDNNITEIQGLGRWIVVVDKKGRGTFLKDKQGRKVHWASPDDQKIVFNKLFEGDLTSVNSEFQIVNGRTIQGYRIAVTDSSAVSYNSNHPEENGYCDFTLRKFQESYISMEDLIQSQCFSDQIGRLLKFMVSNLSYAIIGSTGSGKTTLNRSLLNYIKPEIRTICIQQPTEIDLRVYEKNKYGELELANNRVMWEASEDAKVTDINGNPIKHTNNLNNLMTACLRNTPKIISVNEVRHPDECESAVLIGQAGHIVNLTFHAEDPEQGCEIFTNKVMAATRQSYEVALMDTCNTFKFMICQVLMEDGSRKITDISEIVGVDPEHPTRPIINQLYKFKVTNVIKDKYGDIEKIEGYHKKVGNLSNKIRDKLALRGIIGQDLEELDPDFNNNVEATYTGKVV